MDTQSRPTHFEDGTDPKVIAILDNLWQDGTQKVNLSLGDPEDGSVTFNTRGYIGRSDGAKPILLLLRSQRDWNGMPLATNRILRISTDEGNVLYQHPNYGPPFMIVADDLICATAVLKSSCHNLEIPRIQSFLNHGKPPRST